MFIIDFDDTLFDTQGFKEARREALFKQGGVPREVYQSTYEELSVAAGHSNEAHARALEQHGFSYAPMLAILQTTTTIASLQQHVFPETVNFLKILKTFDQPLVLLTYSRSPDLQMHKIKSVNVESYFDDIKIVSVEKSLALKESGLPVVTTGWVFDDKVAVGQKVAADFPMIKPVLKKPAHREEAEYRASGLPYFENLLDIAEYVRKHSV